MEKGMVLQLHFAYLEATPNYSFILYLRAFDCVAFDCIDIKIWIKIVVALDNSCFIFHTSAHNF